MTVLSFDLGHSHTANAGKLQTSQRNDRSLQETDHGGTWPLNGHANHITQCENHGRGKFLTEDGFGDEETLVFHCDVEREQSTSRVQHANNMLPSPKTTLRQPPLPWLRGFPATIHVPRYGICTCVATSCALAYEHQPCEEVYFRDRKSL